MSVLDEQLNALRTTYPEATIRQLGDGTALVTVPNVRLLGGWNKQSVTAYFMVPVGYPMAKPDCFWADPDLRLGNGSIPKNAGAQGVPWGDSKLWFSWHSSTWSPNRDNLKTYVKVIEDRLRRAE